jgi:hypothetical protein
MPHASSSRLVVPRGLIFLASIWLIASWIIAIGLRAPVQPSSATYTPQVRLMVQCVVIGLMIGWPLLRLSQTKPALPVRQTLLDLIVLMALVQVVLWPLRLVTNWTPLRAAAIDATVCGWVVLAGAFLAAALGSRARGPHSLAMLACISLVLLGPAAAWLGVVTGVDAMELINLSPLMAIRTLGEGGSTQLTPMQWRWIGLLGLADAAAWLALSVAIAIPLVFGRRTPMCSNIADGSRDPNDPSIR